MSYRRYRVKRTPHPSIQRMQAKEFAQQVQQQSEEQTYTTRRRLRPRRKPLNPLANVRKYLWPALGLALVLYMLQYLGMF